MAPTGHLFVLHGKIEHVVHDAAIIPVDDQLQFEEHWRGLLPEWPGTPLTWEEGWGRVGDTSNWLVKVGDGDYDAVLDHLDRALGHISGCIEDEDLGVAGGRTLPLIALPVLGIGAGGHSSERGSSIRRLVTQLTERAADLGVDIALVTPDPSVHAAAQWVRRSMPPPVPQRMEEEARRIGTLAGEGKLALFLGAGASIPAGLLSWHQLITKLTHAVDPHGSVAIHGQGLDDLPAVDRAELIERLDRDGFQERVVDLTRTAQAPSLLHVLAVGLDVEEVVTTNYDVLYEEAAGAANRHVNSVLPWSSAGGARRWILKLHGDIDHPDKIVLTRRHMVRYDAVNRPSAAMLQSLFLTRHVLFLGTSFTDDNLIRLVHEVQAYRELHMKGAQGQGALAPDMPLGTVLDASGDKVRATLWNDELRWVHHADEEISSIRAVELLLDRAGVHASQDSSWLLDPRFAGLLPPEDLKIAALAQDLFDALSTAAPGTWQPLQSRLAEFGARSYGQEGRLR